MKTSQSTNEAGQTHSDVLAELLSRPHISKGITLASTEMVRCIARLDLEQLLQSQSQPIAQ